MRGVRLYMCTETVGRVDNRLPIVTNILSSPLIPSHPIPIRYGYIADIARICADIARYRIAWHNAQHRSG